MRPSDAPNVDCSHDRYGSPTPCNIKRQSPHHAAFNTTTHQRAEIDRARGCDSSSSAGNARTAAAHRVPPAAARNNRTRQPARSFIGVAPAEGVAQTAHEPHATTIPTTVAQRRQRVPLGALARKVHVLPPHAPVLVYPLRAKVVRGNHLQVGCAERSATSSPCAVRVHLNCPSPTLLTEGAANDARSSVELWLCLQALDAHARAFLKGGRRRGRGSC